MQRVRKIIVFCIVGLLIGLAIMPYAWSNFNQVEKLKVKNIDGKVIVPFHSLVNIEADSHYEYGEKIGCRLKYIYHLLTILFWTFIQKGESAKILKRVENQKKTYERYCQNFLEELEGLAYSTNIKLEKLIAVQLYISSLGGRCTVTASTGPATKNNQTFITQNWDMSTSSRLFNIFRHIFAKIFYVHNVRSDYKYIYIGIPIIYEHPLLNEKGLGFGGTGTEITKNNSRHVDEGDGIPPYVLVRRTMKSCANVSEVAELWRNSKRSSHKSFSSLTDWDYDSYVWCDREGGILMIEQTHSYIATVFGDSPEVNTSPVGILWHTNHHLWLDPYLTGSKIPGENYWSISSAFRAKRACELLELYWGNITLDECTKITRDHKGGTDPNGPDSADICCHPDLNSSVGTSISWIIQSKKFTIYMAQGQPCKSRFKVYNFTDLFDS